MELSTIECVYQGEHGDWVYRFQETDRGVLVRRVAKDLPLWSHGVLTQMFDRDSNSFLPGSICGSNVYFASLQDALSIVK